MDNKKTKRNYNPSVYLDNVYTLLKFPEIFYERPDLTSTEKLVLYTLLMHIDFNSENFECYASRERIAKICSLTEKTVSLATQSLEKKGIISVRKERCGNAQWEHNVYTILLSNKNELIEPQ